MHLKTYRLQKPVRFLAVDGIYELERKTGCTLKCPHTLDIPAYLGSARTDDEGKVLESERNGINGDAFAIPTWTVEGRRIVAG